MFGRDIVSLPKRAAYSLIPALRVLVTVFTANLPKDTLSRRLLGDRLLNLEHEGKCKGTRHKFRQVRDAKIA